MIEPIMTTSDQIAIASSVIAFCAFFVSVFQAWATIRHNKLQTRPIVDIESSTQFKKKFIAIHNHGLGPALIQSIEATYKGCKYDLMNEAALENLTNQIPGWQHDSIGIITVDLTADSPILPGHCEEILAIEGADATSYSEKIEVFIHEVELVVRYKCIYGTERTARNYARRKPA